MSPDVFQLLPLPSRGHQQATPSSLDLGSFPFFFFFWLHQAACGTFVPQPGIEPGPQQWKQSPNHWTTREVPLAPLLIPVLLVPQESEKLESVNAELKAQIEELKNEKQHLIYMLNLHRPTCIVRAQNGRTPEDERNLFIQQIKEGTLQS